MVAGSFGAAGLSIARASGPQMALVHDSDGNTHVMDLAVDGRLVVETSKGRNVVVVEGGAAHMEDADCPNQECLHQQAISRPGQQIICLPHELWVEVSGDYADSGAMDVGAIEPATGGDFDTVAR